MSELANYWNDVRAFWGLHPVICWGFVSVLAINNGIRVTWKDYVTRPPLARFIVGATDPICGNFWRLAVWLAKRFGWTIDSPYSDTVSNEVVRNVIAQQEAKTP